MKCDHCDEEIPDSKYQFEIRSVSTPLRTVPNRQFITTKHFCNQQCLTDYVREADWKGKPLFPSGTGHKHGT